MDEFNKFSIEELNQTIFVLDEFQKWNCPDPSLQNLRDLIKEEIENRTNVNTDSLESFRRDYLGKYVKYVGSDETLFFRIDEILEDKDLDTVFVQSKLIIVAYYEGYTDIQYTSEPGQAVSLNPHNLDLRDFILSSPEEFKETINKIINNGLT